MIFEVFSNLNDSNDSMMIVCSDTAEVFYKGEKIVHMLLRTIFAIKHSKVKGPA